MLSMLAYPTQKRQHFCVGDNLKMNKKLSKRSEYMAHTNRNFGGCFLDYIGNDISRKMYAFFSPGIVAPS